MKQAVERFPVIVLHRLASYILRIVLLQSLFALYFVFGGLTDRFLCCTWAEFWLLDFRTHCIQWVTITLCVPGRRAVGNKGA